MSKRLLNYETKDIRAMSTGAQLEIIGKEFPSCKIGCSGSFWDVRIAGKTVSNFIVVEDYDPEVAIEVALLDALEKEGRLLK